jgi:hypothetical protein
VGSGIAGFVLYYGIITPYGLLLRLSGVSRARLRSGGDTAQVARRSPLWDES